MNIACPAQTKERIVHFASRIALNIEGVVSRAGGSTVDRSLVHDPADLYSLTVEQLLTLDRMGEKLASNSWHRSNEARRRRFRS